MIVHSNMPDPNPGRCHCSKFNSHPSVMQYERCLGYADKPHICHFEERKPEPVMHTWSVIRSEPEPWVAPEDRE